MRKTSERKTHLLSVEFSEALPQLHEGGLNASVVGQSQKWVGVAYRGHWAQARLPALLVPRHEGQRRFQPAAVGGQMGLHRQQNKIKQKYHYWGFWLFFFASFYTIDQLFSILKRIYNSNYCYHHYFIYVHRFKSFLRCVFIHCVVALFYVT